MRYVDLQAVSAFRLYPRTVVTCETVATWPISAWRAHWVRTLKLQPLRYVKIVLEIETERKNKRNVILLYGRRERALKSGKFCQMHGCTKCTVYIRLWCNRFIQTQRMLQTPRNGLLQNRRFSSNMKNTKDSYVKSGDWLCQPCIIASVQAVLRARFKAYDHLCLIPSLSISKSKSSPCPAGQITPENGLEFKTKYGLVTYIYLVFGHVQSTLAGTTLDIKQPAPLTRTPCTVD
jgi:hypothetical protein